MNDASGSLTLNRFARYIEDAGLTALLPHNLTDEWLDILGAESSRLYKAAAEGQNPNLLIWAVLTLLANGRLEFDIAENKLEEAIKCYSLHLGLEEIHRRTRFSRLSTVTLENIFDMTYVHTISRAKHDQPLL